MSIGGGEGPRKKGLATESGSSTGAQVAAMEGSSKRRAAVVVGARRRAAWLRRFMGKIGTSCGENRDGIRIGWGPATFP
jgi:hypothetical protein